MAALVVRAARLRDGRVVDLVVDEGRVTAIADAGVVDVGAVDGAAVLEADGRLVTESFVNGHMHLDKVHSLDRVGDGALGAYTAGSMGSAMTAIEVARTVKEDYDRAWITPNVRRALVEAVRHGTLHLQAFVDVDTTGGLEGLHGVLDAVAEFADVLDVQVVAFPQDGVVRDPGAAELGEQAIELGADVVGGIPWIEHSVRDQQRHVDWACELAARTGRRVAMLTDDAGDPALRTTEMLAVGMLDHDLVGLGVACHARAVGTYERPSQLQLAGLAGKAGLAFVSDPQTGPLHLPVDLFDSLDVPVALGQDDISDAYYPFGRHSMLEIAFLCAHALGWLSGPQQERLLDLVTTRAADVLGISGHVLAEGRPANLVVHQHERVLDVLRHHEAPRWVVSRGRVVAETVATTTFPGIAGAEGDHGR
ncbi:amidohydrolase family protein [Salsipaludibacter albus]|uniref:amidohydrolase family protein n=1 Tax=Salsipaludibacter albus TaxID=2849650 RepID=UPI001EE4927C|nr:amidohydrolase family protein [Salsipaludibacter albus]